MCGIIGYIGYEDGFESTFNGLKMLLNRGYDSCGCVGISEGKLVVQKFANRPYNQSIQLLENTRTDFKGVKILAMHSRWSTHGGVCDVNAHPHVDHHGRIALVHNGIIENYAELKAELERDHHVVFKSQTDTEVIVNLIGVHYHETHNMETAIVATTQRLQGTWALAIVCVDHPGELYCARHGSPFLVGFGGDFMMVASEQSGFAGYVNNYVCLNDGDVVTLRRQNGKVDFETRPQYVLKDVTQREVALSPEPFPHWTLKEIHEQYESSARAINYGGRLVDGDHVKLGGLDDHRDRLANVDHIILLGCGTSFHAGLYGAQLFKEVTNLDTVQVIDAGEFTERDLPRRGTTALLMLSQSGETKDLHRCLRIAKEHNLLTVGVVNVVDSLIAREVNCGVYLNAGREVGVASTKAFTSQIIVLSLIAVWFAQHRNIKDLKRREYLHDLRQLSHDIKKTIHDVDSMAREVAEFLVDKHSLFVLGKGWLEPIAKEGALKIKEIGYIHAEGYSAVALKHGPFSLLDPQTPVIIIHLDDENTTRVDGTIQEVLSREAPVIIITDRHNTPTPHTTRRIQIPKNHTFRGVLATIPMQMIAYHLAVRKGNDPDKPRNLAKCVTVD